MYQILHVGVTSGFLHTTSLPQNNAKIQINPDGQNHPQLRNFHRVLIGTASLDKNPRSHSIRPAGTLRRSSLALQHLHHLLLQFRFRHSHRSLSLRQANRHRSIRALQPRSHPLSERLFRLLSSSSSASSFFICIRHRFFTIHRSGRRCCRLQFDSFFSVLICFFFCLYININMYISCYLVFFRVYIIHIQDFKKKFYDYKQYSILTLSLYFYFFSLYRTKTLLTIKIFFLSY